MASYMRGQAVARHLTLYGKTEKKGERGYRSMPREG